MSTNILLVETWGQIICVCGLLFTVCALAVYIRFMEIKFRCFIIRTKIAPIGLAAMLFTGFFIQAQTVLAGPSKKQLEMVIQQGHPFTQFELSQDGRSLITKEDANWEDKRIWEHNGRTLKMWDVASGGLLRTVNHSGKAVRVKMTPDFSRFVDYSRNAFRVFDGNSGALVSKFEVYKRTIMQQNLGILLPDSRRLAVKSEDETGYDFWTLETGKRLNTIATGCSSPYGAELTDFTKDSRYMITTCDKDRAGILWDVESGVKVRNWELSKGDLKTVAKFSADGELVLFVSSDPEQKQPTQVVLAGVGSGKITDTAVISHPVSSFFLLSDHRVLYTVLVAEDSSTGTDRRYLTDVYVLDLKTGRSRPVFSDGTQLFGDYFAKQDVNFKLAPDGLHFYALDTNQRLHRYNIAGGQVVSSFANPALSRNHQLTTSRKNWHIVTTALGRKQTTWDANTLSMVRHNVLPSPPGKFLSVTGAPYISTDSQLLVDVSGVTKQGKKKPRSILSVWKANSGGDTRFVKQSRLRHRVHAVAISPNRKTIATVSYDGMNPRWVYLRQVKTGRTRQLIDLSKETRVKMTGGVSSFEFSKDGKRLLIFASDVGVWDVKSGKLIAAHDAMGGQAVFFDDGNQVALARCGVAVWDLASSSALNWFKLGVGKSLCANVVALSPNQTTLVVNTLSPVGIDVFDIKTGAHLGNYQGHTAQITDMAFLPSGDHVVTASQDRTLRIWNLKNGQSASLITLDDEWIIYTDDGYFDASPKAGLLLRATLGRQSFGIDQLALRNNRPDIILERLNLGTPDLIAHFKAQYQRRLRRFSLEETDLATLFEVAPKARILKASTAGKFVTLTFEIEASVVGLAGYNLYVNDVPVYGAIGSETSGKRHVVTQKVALNVGKNKIEVSALDKRGVESLRDYRTVSFDGNVGSNLYYLAFGVSNYKNAGLNLGYAAKDALDLEKVFKQSRQGYANVFSRVYTDAQVTAQSIKKAKAFLDDATVDDTVVLFIAGHGLYGSGSDNEYYFLTHDADPADLLNTAANFESIEALLHGIAPRRKLFLMDTCQSGARDGVETMDSHEPMDSHESTSSHEPTSSDAGASGSKLASRGIRRKFMSQSGGPSRRYRIDRRRYIYNDLFRRSGAVVLSSSAGTEYSFERADLKNGVFTEAIIQAMSTNKADVNGDRALSVQELRDYVTTTVPKQTNGQQHPVVDRDNLVLDFAFGPVPVSSPKP